MKKKTQGDNWHAPKKSPNIFVETVTGGPRREGFDMGKFRLAIKQAEDPKTPNRSLLYDIYNDILIDAHLTAVMEKREDALTGNPLTFSENNELVSELMNAPWFEDFLKDILNAKFFGYSAMWLDLTATEFQSYKLLPRKNINPKKGVFLLKPEDREGQSYINPPYCHYVVTAGKDDDLGLILKAVPWVLLKRGDISDWATFNELFAAPFRKGTYQMGAPGKEELVKALKDTGSMAWAAIPSDCTLEFIQNQSAGSAEAYRSFAEICDKQISKAFLGNTLTTDSDGGKYKGDVHAAVEKRKFAADKRFVLAVLNTHFLHLLHSHGFNPNDGKFMFVLEDETPLDTRLDMDLKLSGKIVFPVEYWYQKYNIPIPEKGPQEVIIEPIQATKEEAKPAAQKVQKNSESKTLHSVDRIKRFFG